jgi:hypothetical protein
MADDANSEGEQITFANDDVYVASRDTLTCVASLSGQCYSRIDLQPN